jgi:hypothetical protein
MRGGFDLTAARAKLESRRPRRRQDGQPSPLLALASRRARVFLKTHAFQIQREATAALRGIRVRCQRTAGALTTVICNRVLRLLSLVDGRVRLYGRRDGAPRPEVGVGLTDAAHAPPRVLAP